MIYSLILSIGRDPLPGAETAFVAHELAKPPLPERLAPIAGIETSSVPPIKNLPDARVQVAIAVDNVPQFLRTQDAGIATYHTVTGGGFRWIPILGATATNEGTVLANVEAEVGESLTVTLAASRAHARHGYIARQILEVTPANSTNPIRLDGRVHDVLINLPTNVERAGPLRLQRVDDRRWLPMLHGSSGLTLQSGTTTRLQLAAGTYELQDPVAADRNQQFTVPDETTIEVTPILAPAGDGRL